MSPLNEQVSLCFKSCNAVIYLWYILYYIAAPVAGGNENNYIAFDVGEDLMLTASFFDFNLALDGITWTQNSSISLINGTNDVTITNSGLSPPDATSTLTRPGITGVSYAGTYVATATNRAGSDSTTFTVTITGMTVWNVFF